MNGQMDEQKKWDIEVGVPPKNNPDIQSKYISIYMNIPSEPQNEPNIVYYDAPLIKLPRALQKLANYNKPSLKGYNITSNNGLLIP